LFDYKTEKLHKHIQLLAIGSNCCQEEKEGEKEYEKEYEEEYEYENK
jgi:hypothetical protein